MVVEKVINVWFASFDIEDGPMDMSTLKIYYQVPQKEYFSDGINYKETRETIECYVGVFNIHDNSLVEFLYHLRAILSPGSKSFKEGLFDKMKSDGLTSNTPCRLVFDETGQLIKIMNIVNDDYFIDFRDIVIME